MDDLPWLRTTETRALVHTAYDEARHTWPRLALSRAAFEARIVSVVELASPPPARLADLRPVEQYLVQACLQGVPGALGTLGAHAFGLLAPVSRQFAGILGLDELKQRVRDRLLVSEDGGLPRLATFTGLTSLERWVRIMGVRLALDAGRSAQRRESRERSLPDALPQRDPEFYWMRQLYTKNFERILLRSFTLVAASPGSEHPASADRSRDVPRRDSTGMGRALSDDRSLAAREPNDPARYGPRRAAARGGPVRERARQRDGPDPQWRQP